MTIEQVTQKVEAAKDKYLKAAAAVDYANILNDRSAAGYIRLKKAIAAKHRAFKAYDKIKRQQFSMTFVSVR